VIKICENEGIPIKQKDFKIKDVHDADEAFVTGTFAGIIPIIKIDKTILSGGKVGILTSELQRKYQALIEAQIH
jgi:branched-chain amino acid aminotransferase